jgi:hypothetical protein
MGTVSGTRKAKHYRNRRSCSRETGAAELSFGQAQKFEKFGETSGTPTALQPSFARARRSIGDIRDDEGGKKEISVHRTGFPVKESLAFSTVL